MESSAIIQSADVARTAYSGWARDVAGSENIYLRESLAAQNSRGRGAEVI